MSPRFVWLGVALALAGIVGTGFGLARDNAFWLLWVSVGAIVVGVLLAWRGGAMYDVHGAGKSVGEELDEAVRGDTHRGIAPTDRVADDAVRRHAAEVTERCERLKADRTGGVPPLAPVGTFLLLLAGVWLLISRFVLSFPYTNPGQDNALLVDGFGIIVLLSALWLRHSGHSPVALGLCLFSGIMLVVLGVFFEHDSTVVKLAELAGGAWVLLATGMAWEGTEHGSRGNTGHRPLDGTARRTAAHR